MCVCMYVYGLAPTHFPRGFLGIGNLGGGEQLRPVGCGGLVSCGRLLTDVRDAPSAEGLNGVSFYPLRRFPPRGSGRKGEVLSIDVHRIGPSIGHAPSSRVRPLVLCGGRARQPPLRFVPWSTAPPVVDSGDTSLVGQRKVTCPLVVSCQETLGRLYGMRRHPLAGRWTG